MRRFIRLIPEVKQDSKKENKGEVYLTLICY